MQAMTKFNFHTHEIRVFPTDDGTSFFAVASDVAKVLGFSKANDFTRNIPDKHKSAHKVRTAFGEKDMQVVDEPGLYYGVLRSNKPEADPFVEWVTTEVLPSIRRTGGYIHPAASDNAKTQLAMAQEIGLLKNQLAHRDQVIAAKDQAIMGLQGDLIGSLRGQNRLLCRVNRMEKRHAAREAVELVILLESQGIARDEIAARSGKNLNHIRQIIHRARLAGRLPKQGELALN